ncbi:hypothetical protein JMJ35_010720 [Cladonia borealis]|uniref:Secretory lipase n=1 Tax=Cladonia borealis TaxID=184061 RepID=A0AA39QR34_9LECA|nr:hypothetical protein JMJ35_010720 [Cladonia borealis]
MEAGLQTPTQHVDQDEPHVLLSSNVLNAHNFEESYRAHGSVANDPFYSISSDAAGFTPGTPLKVEPTTDTSLYTIPPNLSLSRFVYQSKTSGGSKVPVSAYVLWPYVARPCPDGHPVVAWAHGTSGVNSECAPSNIRHLWHHSQVPYQLALNGYVVVATDYAGLGLGNDAFGNTVIHESLMGPAPANDIFYSIKAAQIAFPEISRKFVVIGSSQGGGGAWSFSEKLLTEPMAGHLGTIVLHPVTNLLSLPPQGPIIPLLLLLLVPSLVAKYDGFRPEDILTPEGMESLAAYQALKGCKSVLFQLPAGPNTIKQGWQENVTVQNHLNHAASGRKKISGPLLVVQSKDDPVVDLGTITNAVQETATMFPTAKIEYHILPNVTHASAMYAAQRREANWHIQAQTECWQVL